MIYSIVVTYNGANWVHQCFMSLINSNVTDHHILAIDNGSTDNTLEIIRQNYPTVEIIETGQNLGFGKSNNIGIRKAIEANAYYIFLLNQDAWVEIDTISKLVSVNKKYPNFGILSPMQIAANCKYDFQFLNYTSKSIIIDNDLRKVKFVNAAGWLISHSCFTKVGGFSNLFFHYGEDKNYCYRAKYHGFNTGIVTNSTYVHDRTQPTKRLKFAEQKKQVHINQIALLSNINYAIPYLVFVQFYQLFRKIIHPQKTKHLSVFAYFLGILGSHFKLYEIMKARNESKKEMSYL